MSKKIRLLVLISVLALALFVAACGDTDTATPENDNQANVTENESGTVNEVPATEASEETAPADDTGYPAPESQAGYPGPDTAVAADPGYPGPENEELEDLSAEPPNPERNLPEAAADKGVIGGVLVREVTDRGFIPLDPHQLILSDIVYDDAGTPSFFRYNESSLRAETFDTGIFVFNDVPPGTYGLIVNLAVSEFPITTEDGTQLVFTVEAGQALDLGQIFAEIP